jgi:SIR2-like domain
VSQAPDADHYELVAGCAGNLIVFVGAGANTAEHNGGWQEGSDSLPDDRDVAHHLARKADLRDPPEDLAEVAQFAIAKHGEAQVYGWIREILVLPEDPTPHRVHELLAGLPAVLGESRFGEQYQMIVTSKYDAALEQAFRGAQQAYDVAVYRVPARGGAWPGGFVHVPYQGQTTPIGVGAASEYKKFPIVRDRKTNFFTMLRTVIVRINGVVDDPVAYYDDDNWRENYVLSEDDYISYLSGLPIEQVVPGQIRAKLMQSSYLFLGYTLADWRLRVFLQRIWGGPLSRANYWAVADAPSDLEEKVWGKWGVRLIGSGVSEYLEGLYAFLGADKPKQ